MNIVLLFLYNIQQKACQYYFAVPRTSFRVNARDREEKKDRDIMHTEHHIPADFVRRKGTVPFPYRPKETKREKEMFRREEISRTWYLLSEALHPDRPDP